MRGADTSQVERRYQSTHHSGARVITSSFRHAGTGQPWTEVFPFFTNKRTRCVLARRRNQLQVDNRNHMKKKKRTYYGGTAAVQLTGWADPLHGGCGQQAVLDGRPTSFHHVVEETAVRRRLALWAMHVNLLMTRVHSSFEYRYNLCAVILLSRNSNNPAQ